MTQKQNKEPKFVEVSAPVTPLSPLFSNIVDVHSHPGVLMLDFSFIGPGYCEPHNIEVTQVARICIPWNSAEYLSKLLNVAISSQKEKQKPKAGSKKSKS